jgi:hypothetical protein
LLLFAPFSLQELDNFPLPWTNSLRLRHSLSTV